MIKKKTKSHYLNTKKGPYLSGLSERMVNPRNDATDKIELEL